MTSTPCQTRAPAVYVTGWAASDPSSTMSFRLPVPPRWDDRRPSAWAAERRARKAYFAALDALATGHVPSEDVAKLGRLIDDVGSDMARESLVRLRRAIAFVERATSDDEPALLPAAHPCDVLVLTLPAGEQEWRPEMLRERYDWTLEWLRTRRFVVGKGLSIEWRSGERRVLDVPPERRGRPVAGETAA